MIESFTSYYQEHQAILGMMAGFSAFMFIASLLSLPWLLSLIPPDYFQSPEPYKAHHTFRHPVLRTVVVVLKNLIGWILIIAGAAMLILPGQGLLTILMGMLLINFPRKRDFERALVRRQGVMKTINWFRAKSGKEPLLAPE